MQKYNIIANDVRRKILDGVYKANEQLPFEKDFCQQYEASKMTVKKALDILVSEGLIIKRRGSGTFVKDLSVEEMERMIVSSQMLGTTAYFPTHEVHSKVLKFTIVESDENVASKLNIPVGSFAYEILRVRIVDGKSIVLEHTYMPVETIPSLTLEQVNDSIYEYIQDSLNLRIQSAHRTITVRKADEFEVVQLDLEVGDPVGVVEQIGYLSSGIAFEYSFSIHRYDAFLVKMTMTHD